MGDDGNTLPLPQEMGLRLGAGLAGIRELAALPTPSQKRLREAVEAACRGFLADRAVAPGSRSRNVADRLAQAAAAAESLEESLHALDGVGLGLIGRGLRGLSDREGQGAPPADLPSLIACVRRIASTLGESAAVARREPQVGLERARLRLAAGVGAALDGEKIPLEPVAEGPFAESLGVALATLGLDPPADLETLLQRAAKVTRRERGRGAGG
ncbi:MAG: hypothetical protein MUF66_05570 [Gammaproteobacteria bacterium]|jgi:hypothetical protein|nr:hypothetical protein [Gammaproteobacteria bacterium]